MKDRSKIIGVTLTLALLLMTLLVFSTDADSQPTNPVSRLPATRAATSRRAASNPAETPMNQRERLAREALQRVGVDAGAQEVWERTIYDASVRADFRR